MEDIPDLKRENLRTSFLCTRTEKIQRILCLFVDFLILVLHTISLNKVLVVSYPNKLDMFELHYKYQANDQFLNP